MCFKVKIIIVFVLFLFINAFSNDYYPLNYQQITKSQLDDLLPDEFKSLFTQPFVYKISISSSEDPEGSYPPEEPTEVEFLLNQIPQKVIARLDCCSDIFTHIKINGHTLDYEDGWVNVTSYCNSKTLKVFVFPEIMTHSDGWGTVWLGSATSLGNTIEYKLLLGQSCFSINAYEIKTKVDIITENFGYNPVSHDTLNNLLIKDDATQFTNYFNQPYLARFELQSGSNIDKAVKMMMNLQQAPLQAIGRGSGENAPQAAIGVEFTKQHNIKTDGFEDIYPYCYTNELYMILNDDPVDFTPGHMILWMGFGTDLDHWLTYQNMPDCLMPELFSIKAYRLSDRIVKDVSVISPANYELAYLQTGDNYYIDRNYYITNIPDTLKDLIWLKTANDDKRNTSNSLILLNLQREATIYVACDYRAERLPDWLIQDFHSTQIQIQVSDAASPLLLWKKDVSSGVVTLGGNLAPDAVGAKSNYIVLVDMEEFLPPVANFNFEPKEGVVPLTVSFQDNSTGDITSWYWEFGDGNNSNQQNPTHTYQNCGNFAVTLNVSGPGGSDSKSDTVYVFEAAPIADFTADSTQGTKPFTVNFTDNSTGNITSWLWNFGDGESSTVQNPEHVYQKAELFTVSLTVTGPGGTDTKTKVDYITVSEPAPIADFTADSTQGTKPFTVNFIDNSTGNITGWLWDFGDGGTSTVQNPEHVYQKTGLFTVSLTVTGPGGTDTKTKVDYITVSEESPVANFSAEPTQGVRPLVVQFTDLSAGNITNYNWNFGDGSISTIQNPKHTYEKADTFTVSLTITGPGGLDTITKPDYIIVTEPIPVANFGVEPHTGMKPLTVQFADSSIGIITTRLWDFGDSNGSTEQNPEHTYQEADSFTVSLTVVGPGGVNTKTIENCVCVFEPTGISGLYDNTIPDKFQMYQNYPNPFNPSTTIQFGLPKSSFVELYIYNLSGQIIDKLVSQSLAPGSYKFTWEATRFPSGVYFYKIVAGEYMDIRKMIFMK